MTNIQYVPGAIDAGGCVSNGWELIKRNYWMYFGITSLVAVVSLVLSCIPFVPILFQVFVMPPITVGIFLVLFKEMRGEPVEFGMFFKGFDKFVPALVIGVINSIPSIIFLILNFALRLGGIFAQILQGAAGKRSGSSFFQSQNLVQSNDAAPLIAGGIIIVIVIVFIIFFLFSIAWGITFHFALPILAENDIGAIDAIKLGARAGWSNIGGLIVLFILEGLVVLLGFLAICVGIFFVLPVIFAANAFAYRQVFPWIDRNFNMNPPPPGAYGSNFGSGM